MKLFQKLLEIQKAIEVLTKNKDGHNYQYVTGTKVLGAIRPLMNEHGLILKQEITSSTHEVITYATKYAEKTEVLAKVMFRFTWVDCESGETDVNEWAADGMNGFDKGIGSAMTYAERYFLLKYFHIPTDELDNDALGEKAGNKEPAKAAPKPPAKPEIPATHANDEINCELMTTAANLTELKARWEKVPFAEKSAKVEAAKNARKKALS